MNLMAPARHRWQRSCSAVPSAPQHWSGGRFNIPQGGVIIGKEHDEIWQPWQLCSVTLARTEEWNWVLVTLLMRPLHTYYLQGQDAAAWTWILQSRTRTGCAYVIALVLNEHRENISTSALQSNKSLARNVHHRKLKHSFNLWKFCDGSRNKKHHGLLLLKKGAQFRSH